MVLTPSSYSGFIPVEKRSAHDFIKSSASYLGGGLEGTSEHNHSVGNRCVPLVDDYVVVFTVEEWNERGETVRHLFLLAVEVEKEKH